MSWLDSLRVASFRGVPFGVAGSDSRFGRRQAVHEYPFRDKPWVEDLGRNTRKIGFRAFIVQNDTTFGGGDVLTQKERLIAACELAGPGELVHPTLGRLTVSLVELGVSERWDSGQFFELSLSFIESGERVFPSLDVATQDAVVQAALDADEAANGNFVKRATSDLTHGAAVVNEAVGTASMWARMAQRLGNDATNMTGLVSTLGGNFGRYSGGRNFGGFTGITAATINTGATVQSLIAQGTTSRNQISTVAATLTTVAGGLGL